MVPLVPWWELVVGASLLVGLAKPWPAVAATVTIAAFTALLLRVLRRGEHPPCACFGTWSAAPLGVRHVVRNVALLCLAVVSVTVSVVGR